VTKATALLCDQIEIRMWMSRAPITGTASGAGREAAGLGARLRRAAGHLAI
jgi:hypothetical protein